MNEPFFSRLLELWPIEDLVRNNRMLETDKLVPAVVLLGTDGAGELFGVDKNRGAGNYTSYPAVGLRSELGERLGGSWEEFLETLSQRR